MKRVLVTGGTGFIGANLARRLLSEGHETHLLVRAGHKSWRIEEIRADLRLHEVCLQDSENLTRALKRIRPDWIFNLAAHGAYSWQTDRDEMVATNLSGTMHLVDACLADGFDAFVQIGSSSEYGFRDRAPNEEERPDPNSHYAVTKAAATMFCRYTARARQVHLPTLRLYSVFGPYEDPGRLLPTVIMHGLAGTLPPLVDPEIARDFVYVDDVVEACLLAARIRTKEWGPVYNVGSGVQTTIREVIAVARERMNIAATPMWGTFPNRQWDANVWVSDSRKIREELKWHARESFAAGFDRMLKWFQQGPLPAYRMAAAAVG